MIYKALIERPRIFGMFPESWQAIAALGGIIYLAGALKLGLVLLPAGIYLLRSIDGRSGYWWRDLQETVLRHRIYERHRRIES